ncbi:serine/threonine protein kinase [Myxococcota bacterium]|nr:serine/threonine protein kinase [Myxococcota bacterium]MBU1381843.1 serine/threonine protein kinase [Myxococcota bacterium]MBU1499036.1 serine/threonine protein kinase [Myxococcota bacterium]
MLIEPVSLRNWINQNFESLDFEEVYRITIQVLVYLYKYSVENILSPDNINLKQDGAYKKVEITLSDSSSSGLNSKIFDNELFAVGIDSFDADLTKKKIFVAGRTLLFMLSNEYAKSTVEIQNQIKYLDQEKKIPPFLVSSLRKSLFIESKNCFSEIIEFINFLDNEYIRFYCKEKLVNIHTNEPIKLDKYEIVEKTASGGYAEIWKIRHITLERFCALKILDFDLSRDPVFAERFEKEGELLAEIDDPGIVKVFDAGALGDDRLYIIEEFLKGLTLEEEFSSDNKAGNDLQKLIERGKGILNGLKVIHSKDIIHRDLKPSNIFIQNNQNSNAVVKLIDFGCAKKLNEPAGEQTKAGEVGTVDYMSPEQKNGKEVLTAATDIYSFGLILDYMSKGITVNSGTAVKIASLVKSITHEDPELRPSIDTISAGLNNLESIKEKTILVADNKAEYIIGHELGRGGFGTVYKATDNSTILKDSFAIKILNENVSDKPEIRDRFINEIKKLNKIKHHNIVRGYNVGFYGSRPFYVMEYLEGETLKDKIKNGNIPLALMKKVISETSTGLQKLHNENIVHRDIKPENIFLSNENVIKILDLGIIKEINSEGDRTQTGIVIGSPVYMSPEQADGKEVDKKSDIYSFAILIYEIITGNLPWKDRDLSFVKIFIEKSKPENFAPISDFRNDIPEKVSEKVWKILLKSLDPRPGNRHETISDFSKELLEALESEPVSKNKIDENISSDKSNTIIDKNIPDSEYLNPNPAETILENNPLIKNSKEIPVQKSSKLFQLAFLLTIPLLILNIWFFRDRFYKEYDYNLKNHKFIEYIIPKEAVKKNKENVETYCRYAEYTLTGIWCHEEIKFAKTGNYKFYYKKWYPDKKFDYCLSKMKWSEKNKAFETERSCYKFNKEKNKIKKIEFYSNEGAERGKLKLARRLIEYSEKGNWDVLKFKDSFLKNEDSFSEHYFNKDTKLREFVKYINKEEKIIGYNFFERYKNKIPNKKITFHESTYYSWTSKTEKQIFDDWGDDTEINIAVVPDWIKKIVNTSTK